MDIKQEKILLVFYVDVSHIPLNEKVSYLNRLTDIIRDESTIVYIVPQYEPSKIECINPKLVTEEDYKQAINVMDKMQLKVDDFMKAHETKTPIAQDIIINDKPWFQKFLDTFK